MPTRSWTPAQQAAIDYRGRNLLLSAAAGSGKTATLTERIVTLLLDPKEGAEITRMLCVTFTRAAAAELRERIRLALHEALAADRGNTRLSRQICDLGRAQITTIHSFCLHALRPHAAEFGLPAGFGVAEEAAVRALSRHVMADVIAAFFDEGEAWFLALADALGGARREDSLDEVLLGLADSTDSAGITPDDLAALADRMAHMDRFFATPAGAGICAKLGRFASHYADYFAGCAADFAEDSLFARAYLPTAEACARTADALLAACGAGDYTAAREALLAFSLPRLGVVKSELQTPRGSRFKDEKKAFADQIKKLLAQTFTLPEADIAAAAARTADLDRGIARVLAAYRAELEARKRDRGIVDFSDLEAMTARLFADENGNPTAAALAEGAAYDYIFIDEYQDTNRRQDAIFSALAAAGGSRFMVGDIKQSIYRFRGAEPDVFAGYRRAWPAVGEDPDDPAGESIFMRENFRCDRTVVDFVNLVSRYLFRTGSIPFSAEDELAYAKPQPDAYVPVPAELVLLAKTDGEDNDEAMDEAEYTARRISALLASGRAADDTPYRPKDMAILLRSPDSDGAAFADALRRRGIPVCNQTRSMLYEEAEVLLMLSVLRAVDNPARDISLAAAMKSPVFGFTLDDLLRIRRSDPAGSLWDAVRRTAGILSDPAQETELPDPALAARCEAFCRRLSVLREDARGMRADELLLRLFDETAIHALAEADPDRDAIAAADHLRALYEDARRFENTTGGGLYPYLAHVSETIEHGAAETAAESTDDAVQIMSIHHAKGLEFPVCFLCRTEKKRNLRDTTAPVLFDPALGAAMRLPDAGGLVLCDTPLRRSVAASMTDAAIEEEMRVLYVALTRAREKLIVTASLSDPEAAVTAAREGAADASAHSVYDAPNTVTWILDAIAAADLHGENTDCVRVILPDAMPPETAVRLPSESAAGGEAGPDTAWDALFAERFAFRYPHAALAGVPAKLTVSRLYPEILDEGEPGGTQTEITREITLPETGEKDRPPRFLAGKTEPEPAFAGTATHVFLQFCDLDRLAQDGVAAELARLRAEGFLTAPMADAVHVRELEVFRASSLLARMRAAAVVRREFRFNAALPAAEFTADADLADALRREGTEIIVQGVVDCLFEEADGRAVLVDYKTDRLNAAEIADPALAAAKLRGRYANQLRYYRRICAQMIGREITECCIYSLPLGDTIEMETTASADPSARSGSRRCAADTLENS